MGLAEVLAREKETGLCVAKASICPFSLSLAKIASHAVSET